MSLQSLITRDAVVFGLKISSKKQLMQDLAARAAEITESDEREVYDALLERERLGATSVGDGVAIPHARLPNIETVSGVFVRLAQPIEYDAADEEPVDLVFLLVAPESANAEHLRALAKISRQFKNPEYRSNLRGADDADALYIMLTEPRARAA